MRPIRISLLAMAAREDEAKAIVLDGVVVPSGRRGGQRRDRVGHLVHRDEARAPAQGVDRLEPAGRNEPGARVRRHAVSRPLLERGTEGLAQRLLGEIEVAEQTHERGEDAARLGAVEAFGLFKSCEPAVQEIAKLQGNGAAQRTRRARGRTRRPATRPT